MVTNELVYAFSNVPAVSGEPNVENVRRNDSWLTRVGATAPNVLA